MHGLHKILCKKEQKKYPTCIHSEKYHFVIPCLRFVLHRKNTELQNSLVKAREDLASRTEALNNFSSNNANNGRMDVGFLNRGISVGYTNRASDLTDDSHVYTAVLRDNRPPSTYTSSSYIQPIN